ncbi:MAG TPA: hypothetical protein VFO85_11475 [Vicinamibacteria bacterium]|nr:hypothetical protein [Vicinamibacteria bacterium]
MKRRRLLAHLLAALMALSGASLYAPVEVEAATRRAPTQAKKKRPTRRTAVRRSTARRAPQRTAARRRTTRRPTAAQRAAERRRREAERREAARRRAAEQERQRKALQKAWQADKGCYQSGTVFTEPRLKDDEPIEIPRVAKGGSMKAALLMYEAHVDKDGRLHSLRTLRPVPPEAPWPQLHQAVVTSVKGWKWEKTKVAGKTIPVCFPVTLNLDLR